MQDEVIRNITMRDYVRILFRQKAVVLVSIINVITVVYLGVMFQIPQYEAQVKMLITSEKQVQSPYYRELGGGRNIEVSVTQSEIVVSDPVLERAVEALELHLRPADFDRKFSTPIKNYLMDLKEHYFPAVKEQAQADDEKVIFRMAVQGFRQRVEVVPVRDTNLFNIKVTDIDPEAAALTANVVSRSYVIFDLEQQLAEMTLKYGDKYPAVAQLKDNIEKMTESLNVTILPNIEAIGPASVKIIEQASVPFMPVGKSKTVLLLMGIVMSLFLGIMLAFMFESMDPTFKSLGDIEEELKLPVLGSIPRSRRRKKLVQLSDVRSKSFRFYQVLCDQLYLLIKEKKIKSILMIGCAGEEGASTVLANLGAFLAARVGCDVLLLDANFRHSSLHKIFGVDNTQGFSDVIQGSTSLQHVVKPAGKGLFVVPAGKTDLNPAVLLDSSKAAEALLEASRQYGIVLIDGPDLSHFHDSIGLAIKTDGTVVVVSEGLTRRRVVKLALQPLVDRKIGILGVVINNRTFPIPKFLYERI